VFVEQYAWACFNVLVGLGPTVALVFWIWIFREEGMKIDFMHEFVVAPFMVVVEICVTAMPLRIAHVYCPLLMGLGYIGFIVGYQLGGQKSIDGSSSVYPIISDYVGHTLQAVGFTLVSLLALGAFFVLACGLVWLRDKFVRLLCPELLFNKYLVT